LRSSPYILALAPRWVGWRGDGVPPLSLPLDGVCAVTGMTEGDGIGTAEGFAAIFELVWVVYLSGWGQVPCGAAVAA
jgi:hypothetical protein